jgi:hemolysin activation/secretion protein
MPLGVLIHDDLAVENLSMEGTRLVVRAGPQFEQSSTQARVEAEVFRFWLSSEGWNLAAHVFAAQTSARTPDAQFWLGGLDSIRGVPDGAVYGTRAAYTNLELRKVTHRWRYLWMQPIVFFDAGGAGADWASARVDARSSVGTGVRFSIPQVYRLVVRADYAWSLDKPGKSGFSAGFNQFFQPYIPL